MSRLREQLGALEERDFRLLFSGTVITTIGDRLAGIALAFAVLDIGSATDLGLVFAVRQGAEALVLVLVGPLSDAIGLSETLWLSLGVMLTTWALILSLPSVWAIRAPSADQRLAPTMPGV